MYDLTHSDNITESKATELIMDACRANEDRAEWKNEEGFAVSFKLRVDGDYEAAMRNNEGEVVAIAAVDKFDN